MVVTMVDVFRPVLPEGGQHKGTSTCQSPGCAKSTREGKPFCSLHIEQSRYVKQILQILADREKEEEILNRERGKISPQGFFVRETLILLRTKDFTAKGLSRRLDLSHHAAKRLISMMATWGLAKKSKTQRGDMTISGLGERDLSGLDD
jgi:predicted HTH transcriptional regulator